MKRGDAINVQGLSELREQLLELGAETARRAIGRAARKAFLPVLEAAIANAPYDSSPDRKPGDHLRDSIRITTRKPKRGDAVVVVGLRIAKGKAGVAGASTDAATATDEASRSPHARWHFVELGTRNMAAQPFLRPALDSNASQVVSMLKDELAKIIERTLKRRAKAKR